MKTSVMLGMPMYINMSPETVESLIRTVYEAGDKFDFEIVFRTGAPVHYARNLLVKYFLDSQHDYLFWVDSDMVWDAADFARLVNRMKDGKMDCMYVEYLHRAEPPRPVERGLGFTIVSQKLISALADNVPKREMCGHFDVPRIFRFDDDDGKGGVDGEDHAFFKDVEKAGFAAHRVVGISLGHVGQKVFRA